MIEDLKEFWQLYLNGCPPEAPNLKHLFKDRWVRFHTLPGSKRYPECEQEYEEVLSRYNTVLGELNGTSDELIVVLPEYSDATAPGSPEKKLLGLFPETEFWCSLPQHEPDDDYGSYWHLHAASIQYSGSELNELFRLVADDKARNIIIVSIKSMSVFHPYDGGVDVILPTTDMRETVKQKHVEWLSGHPDGY